MSFGFAADTEKISQIKTDLKEAAKEISDYIEEIYTKIDDVGTVWEGEDYQAFQEKAKSYRTSLDQLVETLEAFSAETGTLGEDAGLVVTSIKALLDVSSLQVASGSDKTGKVNSLGSLPKNKKYEGGFNIPGDTTVGDELWACAQIGDDAYIDALSIGNNISFEIGALEKLKESKYIKLLPESKQKSVREFIDKQINSREKIEKKINKATKDAAIFGDGALFNCTSYGLTNNSVVGWTQQSTVNKAVKKMKEINEDLSAISNYADIEAFIYDITGSIGG